MADGNLVLSVPSAPNPVTGGFDVFYVAASSSREQALLNPAGLWPPAAPRLRP